MEREITLSSTLLTLTTLSYSSSFTSTPTPPFPINLPILQVPDLIFTLFLYAMLPAIWWWGFCWSNTKLWNYYLTSELAGCPPFLAPDIKCLHWHIKANYMYKILNVTLSFISYVVIIQCLNWYFVHHSMGRTIAIQWWFEMIQTVVQSFTTS